MEEKKKALLIKLSSLGDVIFNIPLANALQKSGYEVHWLTSEKGVDVLKGNPCIDRVIIAPFYKWKRQGFFKSFREYLKILNTIRRQKYDLVIDTQGRWRSLIFSAFSGVKKRLAGSDGKEFSRFGATDIVKMPSGWNINIADKYLLYAKYLGIEGNSQDMTLPDTSAKTDRITEFLQGIDREKPVAVLSPSTTWKTKYWDKDNWKELVCEINERFNLIFTGTKKDVEYINYIRGNSGINLAGKTDILDLVELFKRSDIVISLDSGSTHLARAARAKAIIAIFCSTPESYYAPIGEKYFALGGKLECRPCHKRKCNSTNKMACTKLPEVREVLDIINKIYTGVTIQG